MTCCEAEEIICASSAYLFKRIRIDCHELFEHVVSTSANYQISSAANLVSDLHELASSIETMNTQLIFKQLFDQSSSTYSYLLADYNTREAVLIDAVYE